MQQVIDVITVHDENGSIRPYRFGFEDDEGEQVTVQVKSIVDKKEEKFVGNHYLIYYCLSTVNNTNRTFEIRYRKDLCKWFLMRVI